MKTYWSKQKLKYDGTQLSSLWAYKTFKVQGNSIVAFRGPCEVKETTMVDIEDLLQKDFIYSEDMLHFIVEVFDFNLERMIALQRLLIAQMKDALTKLIPGLHLERTGDDIFAGKHKLTVSIATLSPVSALIHTGINISSKNTPVLTKGLYDYKIAPEKFAKIVLQKFQEEFESMEQARCKVRGVI